MKKTFLALMTIAAVGGTALMAESYPAYGPNSYKALHEGNSGGTSGTLSVNDNGLYLGAAYSFMRDRSEFQITNGASGSGDIDGHALTLLGGFNLHENFALEIRYNYLVSDVSTPLGNFNTDFSNISFFAKPKIKIERASLYVLIGYGQVDLESNTDEDFQWGIGTSYAIDGKTNIFVDYTNLYNNAQTIGNVYGKDNLHVLTFGITRHF